ncbi:MAG: hypothetical protein ABI618_09765 [Nitrospirota bacterium]
MTERQFNGPIPVLLFCPPGCSNATAGTIPWIVVRANIPLEVAGKRQIWMDKAEHLADAARLRISDAAWLARGRVRLAILKAYAAQESEQCFNSNLPFNR